MDGDFFQLLRRIQKEERNKSTLARVDNDFYKQLYSYIRSLEHSVANDPFGNDQLLLSNAQRIATEICQTRERKISTAANNNIYRSFHLFKKGNPQFDLIDTTPLNLTDEEETLYFSLMDALKTHRYNISLDKFAEEKSNLASDEYDDEEEDEEDFDSDYDDRSAPRESRVNPGVISDEEFFKDDSSNESISDGFSGESISVEESNVSSVDDSVVDSGVEVASVGSSVNAVEDSSSESEVKEFSSETTTASSIEGDEVLERLNQIKNSTVVEDEKYEPIEKQINNQVKVVPNVAMSNDFRYAGKSEEKDNEVESKPVQTDSKPIGVESKPVQTDSKPISNESKPVQTDTRPIEDRPKRSSTLDFDSIFADPDSQFADINSFEPDYEADFANIQASSAFAEPSEADLMFSARPKPKREPKAEARKEVKEELEPIVQEKTEPKPDLKPKSKSIKAFAKKEELENTTVVIYKDIDSFMGIDEKVYGPFLANDVVILPNITAKILIDNNKAGLIDI